MGAQPPLTTDAEGRSDLELIAAINQGDPAAFEALYFRYRTWVVAVAQRLTHDEDIALDVLQETFLYVLKKFPGFKLTCAFKTFLYPAVRHIAISARTKSVRYQSTEAELAAIDTTPASSGSASNITELKHVLGGLPDIQREVLLLRFVDGFSLAEIAQAMELPLGTVKSRLHNALVALRKNPATKEYFE